jgi:ribosomal protein S6--L-glutamate ligase
MGHQVAGIMILSFHPRIKGDVNLRLTPHHVFTKKDAATMAAAKAVVLTQHVKSAQYDFCRSHCQRVFPDYTRRFGFEGKFGNITLFRQYQAAHPETHCYLSVDDFKRRHFENHEPLMPFPFVLKGDRGGGGWAVFLIHNEQELAKHLALLDDAHLHATRRFIAQSFVAHGGKDLRVVVIGHITKAYWRCQPNPDEFRNNVGRGAMVDRTGEPHLMEKGIESVNAFCSETGINLAAFDVLFDMHHPTPLLSEINFLFGRKGLGGSAQFHNLLNQAVTRWLERL